MINKRLNYNYNNYNNHMTSKIIITFFLLVLIKSDTIIELWCKMAKKLAAASKETQAMAVKHQRDSSHRPATGKPL